jgi:hypothetical protein
MNGTITFRTAGQLAVFLSELEYYGVRTKFSVETLDTHFILTFEKD